MASGAAWAPRRCCTPTCRTSCPTAPRWWWMGCRWSGGWAARASWDWSCPRRRSRRPSTVSRAARLGAPGGASARDAAACTPADVPPACSCHALSGASVRAHRHMPARPARSAVLQGGGRPPAALRPGQRLLQRLFSGLLRGGHGAQGALGGWAGGWAAGSRAVPAAAVAAGMCKPPPACVWRTCLLRLSPCCCTSPTPFPPLPPPNSAPERGRW